MDKSKPTVKSMLASLTKLFAHDPAMGQTFINPSPHPVADAVMRALAPHPHVVMISVNPTISHPKATIDLNVWCWSPSLHRMACRWPMTVATIDDNNMPLPQHDIDNQVAAALRPRLAMQRMRKKRAALLGIEAPPFLGTAAAAATHPKDAPIDHVAIDRHLLSMVQQAASQNEPDNACEREDMLQQLRTDLACAHSDDEQPGVVARGKNPIRRTPTTVADVRLADGSTAGMLRPTHILSAGAVVTACDGQGLVLLATLPETALTLAQGRPLGSLVRMGTVLDNRVMLDARHVDTSVVITIAPDLVRIGDLPGGRVTAADVLAMPPYPGSRP